MLQGQDLHRPSFFLERLVWYEEAGLVFKVEMVQPQGSRSCHCCRGADPGGVLRLHLCLLLSVETLDQLCSLAVHPVWLRETYVLLIMPRCLMLLSLCMGTDPTTSLHAAQPASLGSGLGAVQSLSPCPSQRESPRPVALVVLTLGGSLLYLEPAGAEKTLGGSHNPSAPTALTGPLEEAGSSKPFAHKRLHLGENSLGAEGKTHRATRP